MRRGSAVLVIGAAAALGALTGAVVLPDRHGAGVASPARGTPYVASSSPSTSRPGPVSGENLLTTDDFSRLGLTVTAQDPDVRIEPVACDGDPKSLDDIASSGPPVQRRWAAETIVASQQVIVARDSDEATDVVGWVRAELEACQKEVPTHWVYGPTHHEKLGPEVTATWFGTVDGELNTTGRAPKGERISGGVAVVRNDQRVSVLDISWCASAGDAPACIEAGDGAYEQLAALSRTAALRLG